MFVSATAALTKFLKLGQLYTSVVLFEVLETGKPRMKVPEDLGPSKFRVYSLWCDLGIFTQQKDQM